MRKYKDYSWAIENDEKTDIFSMKADFKSDFSKTQTSSKNLRVENERWIFPETESVLTWIIAERQPPLLAVLKFLIEVPFQNGAFRVRHHCFQPTLEKQWLSNLNNGLHKKTTICKIDDLPRVLKIISVRQQLYATKPRDDE